MAGARLIADIIDAASNYIARSGDAERDGDTLMTLTSALDAVRSHPINSITASDIDMLALGLAQLDGGYANQQSLAKARAALDALADFLGSHPG